MKEIEQLLFYMGYKCNLNCNYCNLEKNNKNNQIINSKKEFDSAIKKFDKYKIKKILLSGGEPTLFCDEILEILDSYSYKFKFYIISNGTNLNILKKFLKYNIKIIISYDGHINDRGFDSFETIKYLYKKKKLEGISMVISNSNYKYLYKTVKEIYDNFKDLFYQSNNDYKFLEIELARKENEYYNIDLNILENELKKIYIKFGGNFHIFQRSSNNEICKGFYGLSKDIICKHYDGSPKENGCFSDIKDFSSFNEKYQKYCQKCPNLNCMAKVCPRILEPISFKDNNHFYCKVSNLVNKILNESDKLLFLFEKINSVTSFDLILTDSCNLNCKYCFQKTKHSNNIMSIDTLENFFNIFFPLVSNQKIILNLFGGEPIQPCTLSIRKKILDLIKKNNLSNNIILTITSNTFNFTKLDEEWLKDVYNTLNKRVYWQISLDGVSEYNDLNRVTKNNKGTFYNVINNIDKINKIISCKNITINTVLTENNINGLPEWSLFLTNNLLNKKINSITFRIDQTRKKLMTKKEINKFIIVFNKIKELYDKRLIGHKLIKAIFNEKLDSYSLKEKNKLIPSCGICDNLLTLNVNGDLIPCHIFTTNEDKYTTLININELKINNFIENIFNVLSSCNKQFSYYVNKFCNNCEFQLSCNRCKFSNLVNNKDITIINPYTCQFNHIRSKLFRNLGLYERFKPLTNNEKKEIVELLQEINLNYKNHNSEEIFLFVNNLKRMLEEKEWYI